MIWALYPSGWQWLWPRPPFPYGSTLGNIWLLYLDAEPDDGTWDASTP